MRISQRAAGIPASVTFVIDALVRELVAKGVDVIGLGAGQPDAPSPPEAVAAAEAFLSGGRVGYTATEGIAELRAAAAEHVGRIAGVPYDGKQLVVTNGAKEAIALAIAAVADPDDEVLVPAPAWLSYGPMAGIVDVAAKPVPTPPEAGFKLDPETLDAAVTRRTRALLLNSPCNPTGAVYTAGELAALAEVIVERDLVVISDEIYWCFVFEGEHVSPASLPGMAERTIVVNGLSKSHAMTGWRIGFAAGPQPAVDAIAGMKSHLSSNASAPAQHAALAALRSGTGHTAAMADAFRRRRALAIEALADVPGIELVPPHGAFYVFPRVDGCYGGPVRDSVTMCRALLEDARVAAVPGAAFGDDRCIRFSIAASDEQIGEGLSRFAAFIAALRPKVV